MPGEWAPRDSEAHTPGAPRFRDLCRDLRELRPAALARLSAIVVPLVTPHLHGRSAPQRAAVLQSVIERVSERVRKGEIADAQGLLDAIEGEACGHLATPLPASPNDWLERLADVLPQLDAPERGVLEGLYLRNESPSQIAAQLDLSLIALHETRRRGLHALRAKLLPG